MTLQVAGTLRVPGLVEGGRTVARPDRLWLADAPSLMQQVQVSRTSRPGGDSSTCRNGRRQDDYTIYRLYIIILAHLQADVKHDLSGPAATADGPLYGYTKV